MQTADHQIHDRLASALFRLAELGQRAEVVAESPKAASKLCAEVRKLATELERMLAEMQQLSVRYQELEHQATAACKRGDRIFEHSPVPCLLIDMGSGAVADANPAAVRLLNVSHRHLVGRSFLLFLNGDRDDFLERLRRAGPEPERSETRLRPRERSGVEASFLLWRDGAERVFLMIVPAAGPGAAANPGADLDAIA